MPYAPLYGPWSADANDDASTPVAMQGAAYPVDWMMPASATAATATPAGPQSRFLLIRTPIQITAMRPPVTSAVPNLSVAVSTNGGTIIAGGGRDLTPAQRAAIWPGEIAGKLPRAHAEITALTEAQNAGLTPKALATTRPICSDCRTAIEGAGGVLTSQTSALFPR